MDQPKLGQVIEGEAFRDAIHIAIAPVVAGEELAPGDRIAFVNDDRETVCNTVNTNNPGLGIVDPFLTKPVKKGQRFYIFLFPQTITSLRHQWTHPAFGIETGSQDTEKYKASEAWLKAYAVWNNPYDEDKPDVAFQRLIDGLRSGEIFYHGRDLHSFDELHDPDELKEHAERFLGIKIDWGQFSFSCSC